MPEKPPQKVPSSELTRYGFLLMPEYSMMAFTAAIDQLRMANRLSGKQLYEWVLLSETDEPVYASTELTIATTPMRDALMRFSLPCLTRHSRRNAGNVLVDFAGSVGYPAGRTGSSVQMLSSTEASASSNSTRRRATERCITSVLLGPAST